jgi:hypothetical protein
MEWHALIWRLGGLGVGMVVGWATAVTLTTASAWGGWDGVLTLTIMSYGINELHYEHAYDDSQFNFATLISSNVQWLA